MSTNFNPTHRTNRAIGTIKAGTPIRVARYDESGFFYGLLGRLGVKNDHIKYRYFGDDVRFWDPRDLDRTSRYVLLDDYVITDGEHFEASGTDSGWDLLPTRKVSGTEDVNISFHETYYCLYGAETDTALRLTPDHLRALASKIEDVLPKPSPIEDARYIHARFVLADEYRTLAKIDGAWYDNNGEAYTQEQVLDEYDEIEVIV